MKTDTYITTSTGQKVHFDDDRLRKSLQRVGAHPDVNWQYPYAKKQHTEVTH